MAIKTLLAGIGILWLATVVSGQPQSANSPVASATAERALLNQYCVVCHNEKAKAGGAEAARKLTLDDLDVTHVEKAPAEWETIVRKLRDPRTRPERRDRLAIAAAALIQAQRSTEPEAGPKRARRGRQGRGSSD